MDKSGLTIIIPCYKPDRRLVELLQGLIEKGFSKFILVNDGCISGGGQNEYSSIFLQCKEISCNAEIHILKHAVNLGQGRSYKTAFNYYLNEIGEADIGVIQCDADGQHAVEDIEKCAQLLVQNPHKFILGVRNFSSKLVPARSKWGNRITSFVFKYFCGLNIRDTQSGLKGIPRELIPLLMETPGERYEYASAVLLAVQKYGMDIMEYEIKTIYIDNNRTSHFRPLIDSWKIYSLILKFSFSSFSASIIDLLIFSGTLYCLKHFAYENHGIMLSTIMARFISVSYNYIFNRNITFKGNSCGRSGIIKYLLLALIQMILSAGVITVAYRAIGIPEVIIKIVIDTLLFFGSFYIQREWVFRSDRKE